MNMFSFSRAARAVVATAALLAGGTAPALAHGDEARLSAKVRAELAQARRATAVFHDPQIAWSAGGYAREPVRDTALNSCIDQPGQGAMGVHFVKPGILFDGVVDALQPEALIYEPLPDGGHRLVGVEYLVFQSAWAGAQPPSLFGQTFHLVGAGNRYGLPPFYALHVWLWQPNPSGLFADWNPMVRCP